MFNQSINKTVCSAPSRCSLEFKAKHSTMNESPVAGPRTHVYSFNGFRRQLTDDMDVQGLWTKLRQLGKTTTARLRRKKRSHRSRVALVDYISLRDPSKVK